MKTFSIVVAASTPNFGIGRNGDLPWKLAEDMAFFKSTTTKARLNKSNAVIMGRKTWESIPKKFRPLSDRINVIISRNTNLRSEQVIPDEVLIVNSLTSALETLSHSTYEEKLDEVFVIGGGSIYKEAMNSNLCKKIYLTEVDLNLDDFDTFFPTISAGKFLLSARTETLSSRDCTYRFTEYTAVPEGPIPQSLSSVPNQEELQYLRIVKEIIDQGMLRGDRTGTGTLSKFGVQMRFSLRDNVFPLLTTKKVFWRGVAEELLWFVKGDTNANNLRDKGIHIWDGNASREFLDGRGLQHREEGDLGPVYGFQWRHFGAKYEDMHTNYTGKGVDQLLDCIKKIKETPEDRRIVMTAWNPADLSLMALPPCHMFCQFYVANGELSCQMYQRSADMGLGVPFNIASYSLLTVLMAQVCGLKAGDFVHSIGDAHVYVNHVDALKSQLDRAPRAFPKLYLNTEVNDIDKFQYSDLKIEGYNPDSAIKMKMAV